MVDSPPPLLFFSCFPSKQIPETTLSGSATLHADLVAPGRPGRPPPPAPAPAVPSLPRGSPWLGPIPGRACLCLRSCCPGPLPWGRGRPGPLAATPGVSAGLLPGPTRLLLPVTGVLGVLSQETQPLQARALVLTACLPAQDAAACTLLLATLVHGPLWRAGASRPRPGSAGARVPGCRADGGLGLVGEAGGAAPAPCPLPLRGLSPSHALAFLGGPGLWTQGCELGAHRRHRSPP